MVGVHIGLHLEHHAGEGRVVGLHFLHHGLLVDHQRTGARARRGCQVNERVQHFHDAEVVDAGAEKHRGLLAGEEGRAVKRRRGAGGQLHAFFGGFEFGAEALDERLAVAQRDGVEILRAAFAARLEHGHGLGAQVDDAAEALALAHGPGHGHAGHTEFAFHFVQDVQRVAHLAVHLVDEGGWACAGGRPDQAGFGFAVGGVDTISAESTAVSTVGVLGEVLVAGRVEQVDHVVAVLHLHHRAGHRDAALFLDLHPVRGGVTRGLARLDRTGDLDRAREQQQLLGQRRFTRVGVRDDGKGAAAPGFRGVGHKGSRR